MSAQPNVDRNSHGKGDARAGDEAIATLAAEQYGVVSRTQLRALGESDDEIDYRLASKRLHPLWRGVYSVGHSRTPSEGRWLGAVLVCGDAAVLSHQSAAALWGLLTWSGRSDVTVPTVKRSRPGIRTHRSRLLPEETTTHRGIPVTTVARTLLDLGAAAERRVPKALERAEALGLFDLTEVTALLSANRHRAGTRVLRAAIDERRLWSTVTRSDMEDLFRRLVAGSGLQLPDLNARLDLGGRAIEADAVWRDARLIVELDSRGFHDTAEAFEGDRSRDRAAVAAGWRVIRLTWRQLTKQWTEVRRDLAAALEAPRTSRLPELLR